MILFRMQCYQLFLLVVKGVIAVEKNKIILLKSLENKNISENFNDILAEYVGVRDSYDEFKIYKAIAYTTKRDRDGDKATIDFIYQMASKVVGLTVIKNHDWSGVENTVGRVIKAEVVDFEDTYKALIIHFYACEEDDIRKIDNGLYYGISMGFNANYTPDEEGWTLVSCDDVYEVSLVSVPAVPDAHIIKSKKEGENPMDELNTVKAELEDTKVALKSAQEECENLRNQVREYEAKEYIREVDALVESEVDKAIDELEPSSDDVKNYLCEELKSFAVQHVEKSEDGLVIKGFDKAKTSVKTKYSKLGLLGKKEPEIKTEEPVVVEKSAKVNPPVKFTNEAQKREFESLDVVKSYVKII